MEIAKAGDNLFSVFRIKNPCLLAVATANSQEIAREYFEAYREILKRKWTNLSVAAETADSVSGAGDDGRFELRRTGNIVTSMEGLDPAVN